MVLAKVATIGTPAGAVEQKKYNTECRTPAYVSLAKSTMQDEAVEIWHLAGPDNQSTSTSLAFVDRHCSKSMSLKIQ